MQEQFILSLIEKFSQGNIEELDIKEGDLHIRLSKTGALGSGQIPLLTAVANAPLGSPVRTVAAKPTSTSPSPEATPAVKPPERPTAEPGPPAKPADSGTNPAPGVEIIPSPVVATFYESSGPGTPPFVTLGSKVKAGDPLCVLEAMKMMNRLEAEFDGEILAIRAANGEMVEFGQPLFEIKRL